MRYIAIFTLLILCCVSGWGEEDIIDKLVPHIIQAESRGDPHAVSEKGATGLMGIMPIVLDEFCNETHPPLHLTNDYLLYPEFNKTVGIWYLKRLRDHYLKNKYTIPRLLAAYNGGITRLRKLNYNIDKMPRETREYVYKIIKSYNKSCPLDPIKYKDLGRYVK